jgi:hypothetical protein
METPRVVLEDALRRAVGLDAEALTFFSGVGAFVTTPVGQRPLPMPQLLSARRVRDLHQTCLEIAGRSHLKWLHFARYPVSFASLGEFLCEYVERRGTSNLRLQRDPFAAESVETKPLPKRPPWPARAPVPRPNSLFVKGVLVLGTEESESALPKSRFHP